MPSEDSSKGRDRLLLDKAGVLLKHRKEKIEFSRLTPPVSTTSQLPSTSSPTAALIAARLLAQAASTM